MNAKTGSKRPLTAVAVLSFASLTVLGSARAADDPFAASPSVGTMAPVPQATDGAGEPGPQKQGPPAAPEEPAPAPTAFVQQLPASAYPEPTRGLYGGSLWLDMQGLQWPYFPQTGIGLSGYGWVDTMYKLTRIGDATERPSVTNLFMQGRVALRVTPTWTNGHYFVQAQAELIANKDQINSQANGLVDADDVWVRTGAWQQWDITVGRMQAFDVYPLGMGLDLNSDERTGAYDALNQTPTQLYAVDYMLYRPAGPGDIAVHLYPLGQRLRIELLGQWGNSGQLNIVGGRPAAILDLGFVKFRAAGEYQYAFSNQSTTGNQHTQNNRGFGGSVQFVFAPVIEAGLNGAYAINDEAQVINGTFQANNSTSGNRYSFGGWANVAPVPGWLVGVGGNYVHFHNLYIPANETAYQHQTNLQTYVAIQYMLYRQLFIKLVAGYAKSHFENIATGNYDDDQFSARIRVMYLY
jgi:hypothetical protein